MWSSVEPLRFNYANWTIHSFGFVPNDPTLVYIAADVSVYRYKYDPSSQQAQLTDLKTPNGNPSDIDIAVLDDKGMILYTNAGHLSTDGGWTWIDKSGILSKSKLIQGQGWRILYGNAKEIVGYSGDRGGFSSFFLLARSKDRGDSWDITYRAKDEEQVLWVRTSNTSPGQLFLAKQVQSPIGKDGRRTSSVTLSESTDAGSSWRVLYSVPYDRLFRSEMVSDATVVNTSTGRVIYIAGAVGLLRSSDEGKSWQQVGGIR